MLHRDAPALPMIEVVIHGMIPLTKIAPGLTLVAMAA